ncbi:MAG TPA: hypothetical protein VN851_05670 [Thermoanaerobaculia bacterium]|nr:hypothetical protein [Thermoanaerobaculia bacterium]
MKSLSSALSPLRLPLLLGSLLALGASATAQAQDHLRSTASTGIFTLLPKQTVRLHLADVGRTTSTPTSARVELRDERGTLLGFRSITNLRPGVAIHLVLRSANLLGSRAFLYVRAIAITDTEIDNLASAPIFSMDLEPEGADNLTLNVIPPCPMFNMGDPPTPQGSQRDCGGGLLIQARVPPGAP